MNQDQHDAWVKQFMANARKAFGLKPEPRETATKLVQELEQLGYFGIAHYLNTHKNLDADHSSPTDRIQRDASIITDENFCVWQKTGCNQLASPQSACVCVGDGMGYCSFNGY